MFLKTHPGIINLIWKMARMFFTMCSWFVPLQKKTILFASFGGRKFDDSPKAIYDEICKRPEFDDWRLVWVFVEPDKFAIPRGEKIKIDTFSFFRALLYSRVWVSNTGMDRGIDLKLKNHIRIETWHGTPLKRICGEEKQNSYGKRPEDYKGKLDSETIRCAQSEYDKEIFARIFHATEESILLCDLPRNDALLRYSENDLKCIKQKLNIDSSKMVILYTPTYREYLIDKDKNNFIAPPIDFVKWEKQLGDKYVFLMRAHYAVSAALGIKDNSFVKDVSGYPTLNDLYAISDIMISDYSSTYFDYSILDRPMMCFAYDKEEYEEQRGLYLSLDNDLHFKIHRNEDTLINDILSMDYNLEVQKTKKFHKRFCPFAGNASKVVVDTLIKRIIIK